MTTQHTPAPWHIGGIGSSNSKSLSDGLRVWDSKSGSGVAEILTNRSLGEHGPSSAELANANLIAAAPELLAALEAFNTGLKDGSIKFTRKRQCDSDPYHPANVLMCSAIAKAKGEA